LYFVNPAVNIAQTVCVSECPNVNSASNSGVKCATNTLVSTCVFATYESLSYSDKICIPKEAQKAEAVNNVKKNMGAISSGLSLLFKNY